MLVTPELYQMNLYLHIGTEKTGSSYLQSLLALNRAELLKQGIYYPRTAERWERRMESGEISPGNSHLLSEALRSQDFNEARSLISQTYEEANHKQASSVILSNELLIFAISEKRNFNSIHQLFIDCGFTNIKYCLYLREPVEQALSLYKHRAKNGKAPHISEWIKEQHPLPDVLQNFRETLEKQNDLFTLFKYQNREGYFEKTFFHDFLDFREQLKLPEIQQVNPSLNLSELTVIKQLNTIDSRLTRPVYDTLITIPKQDKADDSLLEQNYKAIIYDELKQYGSLWEALNEYIQHGKLNVNTGSIVEIREEEVRLSSKQLQNILACMSLGMSIKRQIFQGIKNKVRKLVRK